MHANRWFVLLAFAIGVMLFVNLRPRITPPMQEKAAAALEAAPLCPWREPQRDLSLMFSAATNFTVESRIITAMLVPAQKRLGRLLNPDENPLRIYRPLGPGGRLGSILVTRVKGEHGGIELVIGADTNQHVARVIVQSHREPAAVASAITNAQWLGAFTGKTSDSSLRVGVDLPETAAEARASAQAIADGVRGQLIVLGYAELPTETREFGKKAHVHADH